MKTMLEICAVALALFCAAPARAEDKAAAQQAYAEGSKYYDLNQYADALEAFKRAYWNYEDPAILFNIAQCHRALRHYKEAIDFYRSYLRKLPDAGNRDQVLAIINELDSTIAKEKAATAAPPQGTLPTHPQPEPAPPIAAPLPLPTTPSAATPSVATSAPARPARARSRAWVWGVAVGGVVVVGLAVGLGVGLGLSPRAPKADGTVSF